MTEEKINSSSSSKNISLASFNNQEITKKDQLSACCNVKRYQIRKVKNKGAVLVLAISYLVTSILYFLLNFAVDHPVHQVWLIPFGITTAIAGWLTDAFIGRYKVIRCSIWIMWLLTIAITVSAVVGQLHDASTTEIKSFIVWYVNSLITTGLIVQFNFSCLNELYLSLLICVCLTLALLLMIFFNKLLIKEPPPKYSFKLIYKVIKI